MKMHLHCLYLKSLFGFFVITLARAFIALFRYHCLSMCQVFMNNNKILWLILQHWRQVLFFVCRFRFTLHYDMSVSPTFPMRATVNWTQTNYLKEWTNISHYLYKYKLSLSNVATTNAIHQFFEFEKYGIWPKLVHKSKLFSLHHHF